MMGPMVNDPGAEVEVEVEGLEVDVEPFAPREGEGVIGIFPPPAPLPPSKPIEV